MSSKFISPVSSTIYYLLSFSMLIACKTQKTRFPVSAFHSTQQVPSNLLQNSVVSSRQTVSGDGYGGQGFTVLPVLRDEEPASLILLHGLGGTGEEWGYISLALSFFSLNFVKFIIPTASNQYVSYLDKRLTSWYDIFFISDFTTQINMTQMLESVNRINGIIRGEIRSGVKENRIFLIGFSQGGGLALTTFLRSAADLGGCMGVATWLPNAKEYPDKLSPQAKNKEILLLHGSADTAVPIPLAVDTRNAIKAFGKPFNLTANLTRLEGEGHILMNAFVMDAIEEYISLRASGTTKFLIKLVDNLTETFSDLNNKMERYPLPDATIV